MIRTGRRVTPHDGGGSEKDRRFEEWITPHWPAMRRLAERLVGSQMRDDVLQEASTAAWQDWSRFDPARGTAQAWLLGITANKAKKALRNIRRDLPMRDAQYEASSGVSIDVDRAIRALPRRQRLAVELHYFVGLSVAETAAAMKCAEGTVKSTLAAARATLRAALGGAYQ